MTNLKFAGARFTKLISEKNTTFDGKLEIKTNVKINSLEKIEKMKETIKLSYGFEVEYGELGKIIIEGDIFLNSDPKTIKDLLKLYKDKKYETPEYLAITNLVIQKATIKAIELEEEINLPLHIKLPSLSIKNQNN